MFSEYYLTVEPEHYIWDIYGDGEICMILMIKSSYDFFLFGQPIFQGYYTVHDMTASTINWGPIAGMNKPIPKKS